MDTVTFLSTQSTLTPIHIRLKNSNNKKRSVSYFLMMVRSGCITVFVLLPVVYSLFFMSLISTEERIWFPIPSNLTKRNKRQSNQKNITSNFKITEIWSTVVGRKWHKTWHLQEQTFDICHLFTLVVLEKWEGVSFNCAACLNQVISRRSCEVKDITGH